MLFSSSLDPFLDPPDNGSMCLTESSAQRAATTHAERRRSARPRPSHGAERGHDVHAHDVTAQTAESSLYVGSGD